MKKFVCLLVSVGMLLSLTACGRKTPPDTDLDKTDQVVELTVWGAEEDEALLQEIFSSFQSHYAGEASFRITFQPQSESSCKDALLADLEGGPDVFTFADDQVAALAAAGGLDPIENAEEIRSVSLSAAVDAASVSGELYNIVQFLTPTLPLCSHFLLHLHGYCHVLGQVQLPYLSPVALLPSRKHASHFPVVNLPKHLQQNSQTPHCPLRP